MEANLVPALADIRGLALFSCGNAPLLRTFRSVLEAFLDLSAESQVKPLLQGLEAWGAFLKALAQMEKSFYGAVLSLTVFDDNPFTRTAESQPLVRIPPFLAVPAKSDLSRLGRIANFPLPKLGLYLAEQLRAQGLGRLAANTEEEASGLGLPLNKEETLKEETLEETLKETLKENFLRKYADWGDGLPEFAGYVMDHGAGEFGRRHGFRWSQGKITPIPNPDGIRLADLSGYAEQRSIITANTRRFAQGNPANNLLLYGDRGTGKSATVKAVCNEYAGLGLRLIELAKREAVQLPEILDRLRDRALRFIIFIDDLSFETADDSFTALKMILEGSASARPPNIAVYATSNRRHLVKERLADRPVASAAADGDLRTFDTMQEQFSLADRFGLTVVFTAPDQAEFLSIAEYAAVRRGLLQDPPDPEERARFRDNALRWERWFNGRSPRTAVQYVDWLAGGADFPWE
jgi:predicted AAA+ superfamily ATPase